MNESSQDLLDAIQGENPGHSTTSQIDISAMPSKLDNSMTPTQVNFPDFDDLSAINTSMITSKSKPATLN